MLVLDERTLLVVNDNNFPYGGGRAAASDDIEFLRIRLPVGLAARKGRGDGPRGPHHRDDDDEDEDEDEDE